MDIKRAITQLTSEMHRLAWRTEQALFALEQWRDDKLTTEQFHQRIDELGTLDTDELYADEMADLDLFYKTLASIKQQDKE